jgi:hypothetical protein
MHLVQVDIRLQFVGVLSRYMWLSTGTCPGREYPCIAQYKYSCIITANRFGLYNP